MKLTAVPQLLLLTVAAVRGAPPLMANHERHGCSHSSAQSHPVEMKQSSLKETQFTLDFNDMKDLERDEKFEGDKLRNRYIGRDFGKDPYLSNQEHDGFEHHVEDRPNHTPCHMKHTDQSSNLRNDQGFPDMEHQGSLYKRDATSTTASPHLDVLNPVDKVYDSPVPELKGGVRRRAAEGPSLNTEEDQIKWVPPPEVMPVSEDYEDEHSTAEPRQNDDPKAEDQGTPKKRYAVDTEQSPHGHFRDLRRIAKSNGEIPKLIKSDEFAPRYGDVRRRRSEEAERSSHLPPKNTAETSEATASTSAPKKRSLDKEETSGNEGAHTTSAPKENSPRSKRAVEHEDAHEDTKEDTPVSSAPGVTEPKKAPRRRDVTHDETVTSSSDNVSSDEVSTTTAPKKKRSHVKRSTEHEETHKDAKEDTHVSSAPSVTEAATSEPKKARRRRDVTQDDTATSTSNNASSNEVSTTSAPKEKRSPVKRSTEHDETHKDAKEDTPVSSAPGVTEASTSGPKNARRRRYVENNDPITSSSGKESSDVSTSAPAPKENSSHVKRSTEHQEVHKDTKENVLESPSPGVKESEKSEPKKERRRRDVEHDETTTSTTGKASSDEGATTSAPKKKRSTEHEQSHNDAKEDVPETSVPGVTESATSEPKKARRRRSVEHDENATTLAPKENSPHVKRSPEHEEAYKEANEDALVSTSPGVPESATSEPKKARRRRSVEHDENATTSAPKENSPHVKRSPEHEEPHKEAKEDALESSSPGVPESTTSEPKKARGRRTVENDENATNSAPKENSPYMKRSPEHEEAHKEVKEDAPESTSPGVPESTTPEPKRARGRRAVENDENATTSAPKENSPHMKRSPEHEEAHKEAKEDALESYSPGVPESTTPEPKRARGRRAVENDENATTSAPKENSPHMKRSPEHEEAHKKVKEDAPESTSPGVPESTTPEPKRARGRRAVENDENATTSAPKENSPHMKRSPEHEEAHKKVKEDAPESTSPGVPESTTPEPKRARGRRAVENDENATTSAPKENSSHMKRSPEHEEAHKEVKEDAPESTSPGVPESTTPEPKRARGRRAVENDENATTSAPKENSPHMKRSPEHEEVHKEVKEDALESTSPGVPEPTEPKKARRRRSVEHDENATTSASKEDSPDVKRSAEYEEAHKEAKEDALESTSPGVPESTTSEPKRARRRRSVEHDENATTSAPKEDSPHVKRSPEHEEPHKEAKEDAVESSSPGVPESTTSEPKKTRKRRAVENDENATTSAPKENSPHVKRSPEHEEAHKEAKEDALESTSPGVPESATPEPKKARRRRSVEHDENATTSAPKEDSPHVKRSPEHEEPHKEAKEDAIESTSPGVHESTTSEPKRARRRRSVEHDENATTSAPKEDSPHVKRSPEHEEPHKEAKEDALESSAPGVPESATPEPKKARRKRAVENDENATTSAPEENSPYVKRSPEHEEAQREAKEDVPEASSPGVTDSPTSEQKKEHNRRSVGDCSHTFFASKDNNGHVKRSVEHEGTHQDTTSPVTLKSETSEPPKEDTRRRRDTEHEKTTEANSKNIIRSPESAGTYQENREKRSAKDEMLAQHDTTGENVKEKATKEPILKREVSRRRRATEDSKHVKSKEEDAPEETRDSNTTAEPCEKKAKRDTEQEPTSALNDGKKPDELQEHAPKPRVEALIMGGEGNCCKGRHPPGMHGNDLK